MDKLLRASLHAERQARAQSLAEMLQRFDEALTQHATALNAHSQNQLAFNAAFDALEARLAKLEAVLLARES